MATVNRLYKDTVFSLLFNTPDAARELYEALTNRKLPPNARITMTTLKDVLYRTLLNDLSFEVENKLVVLIEHQSTINPNMAFRIFLYLAALYEAWSAGMNVYGRKKLTIPRPECLVLYNGEEDYPAETILKLSDLFADATELGLPEDILPMLELYVKIININHEKNRGRVSASEKLEGYRIFIKTVRDVQAEKAEGRKDKKLTDKEKEEAMREAILWCIKNNVLKEFLQKCGAEVLNMLTAEWKLEDALVVEHAEAWEEGRMKGRMEGLQEGLWQGKQEGLWEGEMKGRMEGRGERAFEIARNAWSKGLPLDIISEITGLDLQTIQGLNRQL